MPRLRLAIIGLLGFDHQSVDQSGPEHFRVVRRGRLRHSRSSARRWPIMESGRWGQIRP
jgi:hypothetical protein